MVLLPEVLNQRTAAMRLPELRAALEQAGQAAQLDASGLRSFDSVALAVLLDLRRSALQQGRTLQVRGMPQRLRDLAGLYGVAQLLEPEPPAAST